MWCDAATSLAINPIFSHLGRSQTPSLHLGLLASPCDSWFAGENAAPLQISRMFGVANAPPLLFPVTGGRVARTTSLTQTRLRISTNPCNRERANAPHGDQLNSYGIMDSNERDDDPRL